MNYKISSPILRVSRIISILFIAFEASALKALDLPLSRAYRDATLRLTQSFQGTGVKVELAPKMSLQDGWIGMDPLPQFIAKAMALYVYQDVPKRIWEISTTPEFQNLFRGLALAERYTLWGEQGTFLIRIEEHVAGEGSIRVFPLEISVPLQTLDANRKLEFVKMVRQSFSNAQINYFEHIDILTLAFNEFREFLGGLQFFSRLAKEKDIVKTFELLPEVYQIPYQFGHRTDFDPTSARSIRSSAYETEKRGGVTAAILAKGAIPNAWDALPPSLGGIGPEPLVGPLVRVNLVLNKQTDHRDRSIRIKFLKMLRDEKLSVGNWSYFSEIRVYDGLTELHQIDTLRKLPGVKSVEAIETQLPKNFGRIAGNPFGITKFCASRMRDLAPD